MSAMTFLTPWRRTRLKTLTEARTLALRSLAAAEARRDTRAIAEARRAVTMATNKLLKAEVR